METGDILYGTFLVFVFWASMQLMRSMSMAFLIKIMLAGGGLAGLWEYYDRLAWRHFDMSSLTAWDLARPEYVAIAGLSIGLILHLRDQFRPKWNSFTLFMAQHTNHISRKLQREYDAEWASIDMERAEMRKQIEKLANDARADVERQRRENQRQRKQIQRERRQAMDEAAKAKEGDPHEILGLSKSASANAVRTRYRELARKYHPDTIMSKPEAAKELAEMQMKKLNAAYERLKG